MYLNEMSLARRFRCLMLGLCLATLLAGWLAGCASPPARPFGTPSAKATAAGAAPTPVAPTPAGTSQAGPLVLTMWAPDFLSPSGDGASTALFAKHLRDFEAAQGGKVRVVVVPKARYGKGGLLDLLRTAQPVAPSVLPDLVALDLAELPAAAAAGLFQPLDGVVGADLLANFYPFARQSVLFNGHILAAPIVVDIEHLVYNRDRLQKPPSTWGDLLSGPVYPYSFPLGNAQPGAAGSSDRLPGSFVSQYLSAGGTVNGESRELVLQEDPLLRVLTFYSQAKAAGVLPANTGQIASLDETWSSFNEDAVAMADVSARRYLAGRDGLKNSDYAASPGWQGPATPIASGWALGVLASDPARKRAAADLVSWLLAPDRLGPWSRAAGWLPASPLAWAGWGSNSYYDFLQKQLGAAVLSPAGFEDPQAGSQLQKAISGVLRDDLLPKDAVHALATPAAKGG